MRRIRFKKISQTETEIKIQGAGKTLAIQISASDTIEDVKKKIYSQVTPKFPAEFFIDV